MSMNGHKENGSAQRRNDVEHRENGCGSDTTVVEGDQHENNGNGELSSLVKKISIESNGSGAEYVVVENGGAENDKEEMPSPVKGEVCTRRKDEYDVDFNDTRRFTVNRWTDILKTTAERLSSSDHKAIANISDWQDLVDEIQMKLTDPASTSAMKRQMARIQPLPRALSTLTRLFSNLVVPIGVKFDLLWGMIYLNLKLSYASPDRLKRTSDWLNQVRRVVELFIQCLATCEQDNEARIAVVDFLDPITIICTDSITYLHGSSSESAATQAWPDLNDIIIEQLGVLDATVKHVSDIISYSKVNQDRKVKNMSQRHALIPESEEPGTFPNRILPFRQNPRFYGRTEELEKINKYLCPKDDQSLRTFTIYGRRGVGKTEIALEFAHTNPAAFDALFWIQCETSVSIRQSFTNVAVSLNLPGADRDGHHEENLLAVKGWLKRTKKRWLMIFDNAERDQILRAYWPIGASGAILITSRRYHNFSKDMLRQGGTVKPFNPKQSWELLLQLLGEDWQKLDREGRIPQSEVAAAKNMLGRLEGLALAIQQSAILIKNPEIGGPTIARTLEMFKEKIHSLPERHSSQRSTSETALDALWDMTFNSLTKNARVLLGVLAWLSPDSIFVDLFNPRNQKALNGSISFCRQDPGHIDSNDQATLFSVITPSPAYEDAAEELLQKKLIKQDGRVLTIHRVVQEATTYHDVDDLQESFDIASRLAYEAFPKPRLEGSLYKEWEKCQTYIPHGVHLSKKYSEYARSGTLKGSAPLVKLLCNCAQYLFEISDYDVCQRVIETASAACDDKTSLAYAELLVTAGSRYYELNRLSDCRKSWDASLRIRKERLPHDHILIGSLYHNLGNLETASGNLEESKDYFERATFIWVTSGDLAARYLALTHLCVGRAHMLQNQLSEARRMVGLSESLFLRILGADRGFTAHVHYAYGNIEFLQCHWQLAWRAYDSCLKIALAEMPIHPITAAAYYSLACVEFAMSHSEVAIGYLKKALEIAELRSPTRDDGVIARILWKMAVVLESDTFGSFSSEAAGLRTRAEVARRQLLSSGEGGVIPFIGEDDAERNQEEDSFDALVPLYFR